MVVVLLHKFIMWSLSSTFDSFILEKLEFQIVLRLPSQNAWKFGKLKKIGRAIHGLIIMTNCIKMLNHIQYVIHQTCGRPHMFIGSPLMVLVNPYPLKLMGTKTKYIAFTHTNLPVQAQICYHLVNTLNRKYFNGGTFFNKYAHGCIYMVGTYCITLMNS
jgi:hypothetical protein